MILSTVYVTNLKCKTIEYINTYYVAGMEFQTRDIVSFYSHISQSFPVLTLAVVISII